MTREEFTRVVTDMVKRYVDNYMDYDSDPQLRINPALLKVDIINGSSMHKGIEYSDEVVENAAAAHGLATQDTDDFQASQDPDFYPVGTLLHKVEHSLPVPDADAIARVVDVYFGKDK